MKKLIYAFLLTLLLPLSVLASVVMPRQAIQHPVNVSFVQTADTAIFKSVNTKIGIYQLTLHNIHRYTTYFSDRPNRLVGQVSYDDFLTKWRQGSDSFKNDAPNAVLNAAIHDREQHDSFVNVVVELSHPKYSLQANSLTYDAHLLQHSDIPPSGLVLHHVVLFIDDACLTCIG